MNATSRSQIYEQVFKCTLTIAFVMLTVDSMPYIMQLLTRYTMLYSVPDGPTAPEIMAAWANAASSAATLLSFIYLIFFYMKKKKGIAEKIRQSAVSSLQESAGKLMSVSYTHLYQMGYPRRAVRCKFSSPPFPIRKICRCT